MKQKKIAWITDSTIYMDKEFLERNNIHVVPLYVIFNDQCYKEEVEITVPEFFEKLHASDVFPKTSQPAIGDFVALYEKLKEEYDCGIAIHVSSGISGTFQTSKMAAEMTGFDVEVIDSWMGSFPMACMFAEGIKLEQEGKSRDEIAQYLRTIPPHIRCNVVVENLELLHRGGRVSGTQYFLGSMLQIKPIVGFVDKQIVQIEKVRKSKKAKKRIVELFEQEVGPNDSVQLSIIHIANDEEANEWKSELQERFPQYHIHISYLGPLIGVHTGEGVIGLTWYKTDKPFVLE
ncbi:DegV family protein [Brevibacillus ginsengisoli]|uniref:DegV family protein n=1 Tax=Brevibacillus ginsengisoli TaxID=363854 RepID=UPI003CF56249